MLEQFFTGEFAIRVQTPEKMKVEDTHSEEPPRLKVANFRNQFFPARGLSSNSQMPQHTGIASHVTYPQTWG